MRKTLTACLVVALTAVAGCGGDDDQAAGTGGQDAAKTIKIGLLAPLTGAFAADGETMVNGANLAIKELNEAGGVAGYTFELATADMQDLKPDVISNGVRGFIGDSDVKAVMAGYASSNNFEIDLLARAGMPYILAGNSSETAKIIGKSPDAYPTIWSVTPSYEAYGTEPPKKVEELAEAAGIDLRDKTAFVVTSANPYSEDISNRMIETMKSSGWTVVGEETVPFGPVKDWGTVLAKIRRENPSFVVNTDYQPANGASFVKQFVQNPTDSLVFLQYGPSVPEFLKLTKDDSSGILYDNLAGAIASPKWQPAVEALEKYAAEYGEDADPGVYGAQMYEQIRLYADALEQVGDPDKKEEIGAAIGKIRKETAFGTLEFDPATHLAVQGDDAIPLQWFQIVDGERILISPEDLKTGDFVAPPWMK